MNPSRIAMHDTVSARVVDQGMEDLLHGGEKLISQTLSLSLVPQKGFFEIASGCWTEDEVHRCRARI